MCAEQLAGGVPWAHGYRSVWSWASSSSMNRALTVPPSLGYCELNELLHVEYLEHIMSPETVSCPSRGLIQLLLVLPPHSPPSTHVHTLLHHQAGEWPFFPRTSLIGQDPSRSSWRPCLRCHRRRLLPCPRIALQFVGKDSLSKSAHLQALLVPKIPFYRGWLPAWEPASVHRVFCLCPS